MENLLISTKSIQKNIDLVRKQAGVQLIGVIDHGGYGCGTRFLARAFVSAGVQMLASSDAETVGLIRQDFPQASVLLLSPVIGQKELDCILRQGVIATVDELTDIVRLNAAAEEAGEHVKVHLLIRTEKNGCGISFSQAERVAKTIGNCPFVEVDGAYSTVLNDCIAKEKAVLRRKAIFDKTVALLKAYGVDMPVLHMAEGYASLRYPDITYNAVRVGDAVIGRLPARDRWHLDPVGEIETRVIGHTVIAAEEEKELKTAKDRRCALIPLSSVEAVMAAAKDGLLPGSGKKPVCLCGKKKYRITGHCNSTLLLAECGKNDLPEGESVRFSADPRLVGQEVERKYE